MDFPAGLAEQAVLLRSGSNITLPTNGTNVVAIEVDVRLFQSYYLMYNIAANGGPQNAFSRVEVGLVFDAGPTQPFVFYVDQYEQWCDQPGGTPAINNGDTFIQDVMHGPFMNLSFTNNSATQPMIINSYGLFGTTRTVNATWRCSQVVSPNASFGPGEGDLLHISNNQNIAANGSIDLVCAVGYGRFQVTTGANATGIITVTPNTDYVTTQYAVAANSIDTRELWFPKHQMRLHCAAGAAGAVLNAGAVINGFDKVQ